MTRITRRELLCENIVAADRIAADRSAEDAIAARALETAPHSYAELKAANAAGRLGALLAGLDDATLRMQALRFVLEREAELGVRWGWGDVDAVQVRFARLAATWQAEQRALVQLELAAAAHTDACETAESREELAAAQETHLWKADIYFARRLAREELEGDAIPPATAAELAALLNDRAPLAGQPWRPDGDWAADGYELAVYTRDASDPARLADLLAYIWQGPMYGEWWEQTPVEVIPGHCYVFAVDTTKSGRSDMPGAWDAFKAWLSVGTPVRRTDRAGPGTRGTQAIIGVGPALFAWR